VLTSASNSSTASGQPDLPGKWTGHQSLIKTSALPARNRAIKKDRAHLANFLMTMSSVFDLNGMSEV
jgi:hypothetical protein